MLPYLPCFLSVQCACVCMCFSFKDTQVWPCLFLIAQNVDLFNSPTGCSQECVIYMTSKTMLTVATDMFDQ